MKRLMRYLLMLAACPCMLLAQQQSIPQQQGAPLGKYLSPNGSLRTPPDFSGALDPKGWRMSSGPNGEPNFVPAENTRTSILSCTSWDTSFRYPGIRGTVFALAVIGTDLYAGGNFISAG